MFAAFEIFSIFGIVFVLFYLLLGGDGDQGWFKALGITSGIGLTILLEYHFFSNTEGITIVVWAEKYMAVWVGSVICAAALRGYEGWADKDS